LAVTTKAFDDRFAHNVTQADTRWRPAPSPFAIRLDGISGGGVE